MGGMSRKSLSPPVAQSAVPRSIISASLCQCVLLPTKHNILRRFRARSSYVAGRCIAFLSEYHSCTCFLSKMGDERRNYREIISGCCTRSQIFMRQHLKAQANGKSRVTYINKMVNPRLGSCI